MNCKRCGSDHRENFNGEVAIHFPGLEGLNKPIVWVFPRVVVCLDCGVAEFVLPAEQLLQLKSDDSAAHL
jgi:hypothetical protein